MRGHIVWDKGGESGGVHRGTWYSPVNPVLCGVCEHLLVFSQGTMTREGSGSKLDKREFYEYSKDLWHMYHEPNRNIGHPAPFPVELPRRLIKLYSFKDDVILDPFMGSGTTGVAAKELGRQYIGYDTSQEYVDLATERLRQEMLFT